MIINNNWLMTWKENNDLGYSDRMLGIGESGKVCIAVNQYTLDGRFVASHVSQAAASRATGADRSDIGRCMNGKRESVGGFVWKKEPKK